MDAWMGGVDMGNGNDLYMRDLMLNKGDQCWFC